MKKVFAVVSAIVLMVVVGGTAEADRYTVCVPKDAYVEVVEHPAVTHVEHHDAVTKVVHHEAVTETVPAIWANFSPNDSQGPFEGPPTWPTDPRGTWNDHGQLPPGQAGPDGVYQQGNGNGSWFYRQAESVVVIEEPYDETVTVKEAYDEVVVDRKAFTETVEHPAVTCPDKPEPPVVTPVPDEPKVDVPRTVVKPTAPVKHNAPVVHDKPKVEVPTVVDSGL